jgi:uncharacterized protein (AIM24 family)
MTQTWNPQTLPSDDNVNPYSFCLNLAQPWFTKKGAMIAYYGGARFEPLAVTSLAAMVASRFSSPLYAQAWVIVTGQGQVVIADRGYDVNSFDLDDGNLTIRASNLLAFAATLDLKQSIVPGFLTLVGTGKFIASSNGAVIFAEPPIRVDPQALLGWADCPSPSHHYDAGWMQGFLGAMSAVLGRQSGEERQMDFTGAGTVLIQSSETLVQDAAALRQLQSQVDMLDQAGMQRLHSHLATRLQAGA